MMTNLLERLVQFTRNANKVVAPICAVNSDEYGIHIFVEYEGEILRTGNYRLLPVDYQGPLR